MDVDTNGYKKPLMGYIDPETLDFRWFEARKVWPEPNRSFLALRKKSQLNQDLQYIETRMKNLPVSPLKYQSVYHSSSWSRHGPVSSAPGSRLCQGRKACEEIIGI
jgi:hypothetical protein